MPNNIKLEQSFSTSVLNFICNLLTILIVSVLLFVAFGGINITTIIYTLISILPNILNLFPLKVKWNIVSLKFLRCQKLGYIYIIYAIIGAIPSLMRILNGDFWEPHNLIVNSIFVPFLMISAIEYVRDGYIYISELIEDKLKESICNILCISMQALYLYSIFYTTSFEMNKSFTLPDILNCIFITFSSYIILAATIYFFSMLCSHKHFNEDLWLENIFPAKSFTAIFLYFLSWGLMAIFPSNNRLEPLFYLLSSAFFIVYFVCFGISSALYTSKKGLEKYYLKIFFQLSSFAIYAFLIHNLEQKKFSLAMFEMEAITQNANWSVIVIVALLFFLLFGFFYIYAALKRIKKSRNNEN